MRRRRPGSRRGNRSLSGFAGTRRTERPAQPADPRPSARSSFRATYSPAYAVASRSSCSRPPGKWWYTEPRGAPLCARIASRLVRPRRRVLAPVRGADDHPLAGAGLAGASPVHSTMQYVIGQIWEREPIARQADTVDVSRCGGSGYRDHHATRSLARRLLCRVVVVIATVSPASVNDHFATSSARRGQGVALRAR